MAGERFRLFKAVMKTKDGPKELYIYDKDEAQAGLSLVLQGKVAGGLTTPRVKIEKVRPSKRMVFKRIK